MEPLPQNWKHCLHGVSESLWVKKRKSGAFPHPKIYLQTMAIVLTSQPLFAIKETSVDRRNLEAQIDPTRESDTNKL